MGNTVGSRSPLRRLDPVTTDSRLARDEMAQSVSRSEPSHAGFSSKRELGAYISGYVDGEGCFSISIASRPKLHVGWEVRPSFSVGQKRGRTEVLELMLQYFVCGTIRYSSTDNVAHYETRSIRDIEERIIPHFEQFPLLSSKQRDFERFKVICAVIHSGQHLNSSGLKRILELTREMLSVSLERKQYLENVLKSFPKRMKV